MDAERIRQIAAWLAATDIGLLELRGPGQTLVLRHDGIEVEVVDGHAASAAVPDALTTVVAPSLGVFLHRHPLREDLLAAPGAPVHAQQTLGLLRIGPLLLPVRSPVQATMHELLVTHDTVVGYGTPLVALRDAAES